MTRSPCRVSAGGESESSAARADLRTSPTRPGALMRREVPDRQHHRSQNRTVLGGCGLHSERRPLERDRHPRTAIQSAWIAPWVDFMLSGHPETAQCGFAVAAVTLKPMTAIATRRWTDADTTWFAISGVGPELAAPAEQIFMDYQRQGDEWRRGYPTDAPGLDICWQNFVRFAEQMLLQAARLQPIRWRETLHELCLRTRGTEFDWWLTGSTALAVRGASIEPGDVDLVCSAEGAITLGILFADALIEPVVRDDSDPISDYWGRAFLTARLEWIGAPKAVADSPWPSDFGLVAASRLETVTWEGWQLRVPPLDLQRAVSERRRLTARVALIDALLNQ